MSLPEKLYSAEQTRLLDSSAIEHYQIPGMTLMERAGESAFALLRTRWSKLKCLLVFCGVGNNAGDGYVLARLGHNAGLAVTVLAVGEPDRLQGDALQAFELCRDAGVDILPYDGSAVPDCQIMVDALFGTGLDRDVTDLWLQAIQAMNQRPKRVPLLALDIPSGLHADNGVAMAEAVEATATITFIAVKTGLLTGYGMDYTGELLFDDLFIPAEVYDTVESSVRRLTKTKMRDLKPQRKPSMHKGDAGHLVVLGGDIHMGGAARLAGEAAYRSGAGLVSIGTHEAHSNCLHNSCPELIVYGVASLHSARELVEKGEVVAIGPGLGHDSWGRYLFHATIDLPLPLVVDADGLNLLADKPRKRDDWILTPHPGEAARLLKKDTADIQKNRFDAVRQICKQYGGVCVLKGAGTLIAVDGSDDIYLCNQGNAGMATAGMGDVLTGIIAGLLAQKLRLIDAACLGVWLHANAGDRVKETQGAIGMLASDLMPEIRVVLNHL